MTTQLTASSLKEIAGELDDDQVIEILALRPKEADVLKAMSWLQSSDNYDRLGDKAPTGIVGDICDILSARDTAPDEEPA